MDDLGVWVAMVMTLSTVLNAAADTRLEVYYHLSERHTLGRRTFMSFLFHTSCPFRVSSIISEDSLMAPNKKKAYLLSDKSKTANVERVKRKRPVFQSHPAFSKTRAVMLGYLFVSSIWQLACY